jgi:S-adenosylmethionine-dependent methyltransferase
MARSSNRRYHDRVAPRYEEQHENDPYLSFCRELTWRHCKRYLPADAGARVLDAGCGPGHFGVKLLRSGYAVDFLDLSEGMLEQARRNVAESGAGGATEPRFVRASLDDRDALASLGDATYRLVLALGDVLSFVPDPARALRNVSRVLAPGGVVIASVDQRLAGIEHFLEGEDLDGLERFLADGKSEWLAKQHTERFATRMFSVREIEKLVSESGLELDSMIGRPVLPFARFRALLADPATRRRALAIEESLRGVREALGRASHLEFAARKPVS